MKNLTVIILNGSVEDKEVFNRVLKNDLNYMIWNDNINHSIASYMGWGIEDRGNYEFREFQSRLSDLANNYFSFPIGYIERKIKKAASDEKCRVLIFHDIEHELAEKISGECDKLILEINLVTERKETVDGKIFEMNVHDEMFVKDIQHLLDFTA